MRPDAAFQEFAKRHLPKGWKVKYWRTRPYVLNVRGYRGQACAALCDSGPKIIWMNPTQFTEPHQDPYWTFAHEVGHARDPMLEIIGYPEYLAEYFAEREAAAIFRADGRRVSRENVRQGKQYVQRMAYHEGLQFQELRADVRRWIGSVY